MFFYTAGEWVPANKSAAFGNFVCHLSICVCLCLFGVGRGGVLGWEEGVYWGEKRGYTGVGGGGVSG